MTNGQTILFSLVACLGAKNGGVTVLPETGVDSTIVGVIPGLSTAREDAVTGKLLAPVGTVGRDTVADSLTAVLISFARAAAGFGRASRRFFHARGTTGFRF